MKQGNLNLEYQEQSDTILFKCKDSGTEYHHDTLDFEFVRIEIDKKNKSVVDSKVLTYDYCISIGFCDYGIKDFCNRLCIDIDGTFTKKELIKTCKENEESLFLLTVIYSYEIKKLIGDTKFSDEILDKYKDDDNWRIRSVVADNGYALEQLKDDSSYIVRACVAKQGYALEELKVDVDENVRLEVARKGYALDIFKNDKAIDVRQEVARQGCSLEELKGDDSCNVRAEVVRQGYALDELKDDTNAYVRREVARQGYALEQLKDDDNRFVRLEVAEKGYALEELSNDPNCDVRFSARIRKNN